MFLLFFPPYWKTASYDMVTNSLCQMKSVSLHLHSVRPFISFKASGSIRKKDSPCLIDEECVHVLYDIIYRSITSGNDSCISTIFFKFVFADHHTFMWAFLLNCWSHNMLRFPFTGTQAWWSSLKTWWRFWRERDLVCLTSWPPHPTSLSDLSHAFVAYWVQICTA